MTMATVILLLCLTVRGAPAQHPAMSAPDMPPGPMLPHYEFVVDYHSPKSIVKFRNEIIARLQMGIPQSVANEGLPVSHSGVRTIARRMGITKAMVDPELVKDKRVPVPIDPELAYDMYVNRRMTVKKIIERTGFGAKAIRAALFERNVRMRNRWSGKFIDPTKPKRVRVNKQEDADTVNVKANHYCKDPNRYIALRKWRSRFGKRYLPGYFLVKGGMPMTKASEMTNCRYQSAQVQFYKLQKKYFAYLDYGMPVKVSLLMKRARLNQYEYVAKQQGISVLDWMRNTLSSAADKLDDRYDRIKRDEQAKRIAKLDADAALGAGGAKEEDHGSFV